MTDDNNLMRHLFDQATDTGPATAALDRLIYCHLLDRITGGNLAVAVDQFAKPGSVEAAAVELEQLDDNERKALAETVVPEWNEALSRAVVLMVRACRRLGYNPDGLGPDHLALLASVLLCAEGQIIPATP
jgi:hypothetical protein